MADLDLDAIALEQHTAFARSLTHALWQAYVTWLEANEATLSGQEISEAVVAAGVAEFAVSALSLVLRDATPQELKNLLNDWCGVVKQGTRDMVLQERR